MINIEQSGDNKQARITLHQLLKRHFNLNEIRTLCFELDIKFDDLGGEPTLDGKIQELIDYKDRRLELFDFVEALKERRPKVTWPIISRQTEPVSFDPDLSSHLPDNNTSIIPTGFTDLDKLTGGLQSSTLNVVVARPGMGKTSFVTTLAQVVARRYEKPVVFFNLQMTNDQLTNRVVAMNTRIDSQRLFLKELSEEEWGIYLEAIARLSNVPLFLIDDLQISLVKMIEECKRHSIGGNLGLIIVDGLEHLWPELFKLNEGTEQVISARWFQYLARTFNVPVIVTLELGNQVEERRDKRPQLRDVPGDWGFIADSVMALYRDDYYYFDSSDRPNIAEMSVLKNRNGPTGAIDLFWHARVTAFRNLIRQEIEL